jgi:hypothetical protein
MPGTYLAGKGGNVAVGTAPGTTIPFRSWKCSMKAVALKINDFTCQGQQLVICGFISASISLEGAYFAGGSALTCGNVYSFILSYSGTLNITVSALITDLTPTVDAEKEETLSVTADSTGLFTAAVT